jgi:hypothetical protein
MINFIRNETKDKSVMHLFSLTFSEILKSKKNNFFVLKSSDLSTVTITKVHNSLDSEFFSP